jgi:predicted metallopeptidase
MEIVVRDVVGAVPELAHVETDRILISVTQARQKSKHGVYASCVPLRFEGGSPETKVGKRLYRMRTLMHEGREILYVLYFMLPRFHEEQDYREKLATVIHELYHISPHFNGDIRRFPGKNFAHGTSREKYHEAMRVLADRYLHQVGDQESHAFLKAPFGELLARPGGVTGRFIPRPKALLVTGS